jgi:hypothetical protein
LKNSLSSHRPSTSTVKSESHNSKNLEEKKSSGENIFHSSFHSDSTNEDIVSTEDGQLLRNIHSPERSEDTSPIGDSNNDDEDAGKEETGNIVDKPINRNIFESLTQCDDEDSNVTVRDETVYPLSIPPSQHHQPNSADNNTSDILDQQSLTKPSYPLGNYPSYSVSMDSTADDNVSHDFKQKLVSLSATLPLLETRTYTVINSYFSQLIHNDAKFPCNSDVISTHLPNKTTDRPVIHEKNIASEMVTAITVDSITQALPNDMFTQSKLPRIEEHNNPIIRYENNSLITQQSPNMVQHSFSPEIIAKYERDILPKVITSPNARKDNVNDNECEIDKFDRSPSVSTVVSSTDSSDVHNEEYHVNNSTYPPMSGNKRSIQDIESNKLVTPQVNRSNKIKNLYSCSSGSSKSGDSDNNTPNSPIIYEAENASMSPPLLVNNGALVTSSTTKIEKVNDNTYSLTQSSNPSVQEASINEACLASWGVGVSYVIMYYYITITFLLCIKSIYIFLDISRYEGNRRNDK